MKKKVTKKTASETPDCLKPLEAALKEEATKWLKELIELNEEDLKELSEEDLKKIKEEHNKRKSSALYREKKIVCDFFTAIDEVSVKKLIKILTTETLINKYIELSEGVGPLN